MSEQCCSGHGSDHWCALQERGICREPAFCDRCVDGLLKGFAAVVEFGQMGLDVGLCERIMDSFQAAKLACAHGHQLVAPARKRCQVLALFVGRGCGLGLEINTKRAQTFGVDRIGLGQPPFCLGEAAGLQRIDAGKGNGRLCQKLAQQTVMVSRGLHHHEACGRIEGAGKFSQSFLRVGDLAPAAHEWVKKIDAGFGRVAADEVWV